MTIEKIHIRAFGAFADRDLSFGGGINIIEGENESGKTTIAAFLRFLFYGFSGPEERARYSSFPQGKEPDTVGGWLDGTFSGDTGAPVRCRITRTLDTSDTSFVGRARITDPETGTRLFADREPWEVFFGVPADIFVSTAFVRQITASGRTSVFPAGTEVPEHTVRTAMENILTSADAQLDPAAAASYLETQRNAYYCPETNSGSITVLEKQKNALKDKAASAKKNYETVPAFLQKQKDPSEAETLERKISECRSRIKENDARCVQLETVRTKYEEYRALDRVGELAQLRSKKAAAERKAAALTEAVFRSGNVPDEMFADDLRDIGAEMEKNKTLLEESEEALRTLNFEARKDNLRSQMLTRADVDGGPAAIRKTYDGLAKSRKLTAAVASVVLALTILSAAATIFFGILQANIFPTCALLTGILTVFSVILFVSHSGYARDMDAILSRYGCKSDAELRHFSEEYGEIQSRLVRHSAEREAAAAALRTAKARYLGSAQKAAELLCRLQPKDAPAISAERLTPKLVRHASDQLDRALSEITALDGKISAYGEQIRAVSQVLGSDDEDGLIRKRETLRRSFGGKQPEEIDMGPVEKELELNLTANKALVGQIASLTSQLETIRSESTEAEQETVPQKQPETDPAVCERLLSELDAELLERRRIYHAYNLAAAAVRRAGTRLRESIAPRLADNAGTFLRVLSDGQYTGLSIEGGLSVISTDEDGTKTAYPISYMSAGTQDLAYLCLRMALVSRLFEKDLPPLLFDDAFTVLDDKRLARVIGLLSSVSQANDAQILVLTCHTREQRITKSLAKEYTYIGL